MNFKKVICGIIVFVLMFSISVLGYSDENLELQIPEEYIETKNEQNDMLIFNNGIGNFNIIVKENTNNADLTQFTKEQIQAIEQSIDKTLEDANMPNEMMSSKVVKVKEYDSLLIKNQCKKTPDSQSYIYQYKYIFTTKNKVYYITYSTSIKDTFEEFESIINTIKIKDELFEKNNEVNDKQNDTSSSSELTNTSSIYLIIVLVLVVILLVGAIIIVLVRLRK